MISGPAKQDWQPLRRWMSSPFLPLFLLLSRKILKKGIKRDASLFVVFKDPKYWDSWHCSTVAQAWAQDVSDVLSPSFKPATGEKDLFEAKQKYMYAIFERPLHLDKGKALVRSYESTFRRFLMNYVRMPSGLPTHLLTLQQDTFPTFLVWRLEMVIGNGTAHSFILNWHKQVWLYECLTVDWSLLHFALVYGRPYTSQKLHVGDKRTVHHPSGNITQVAHSPLMIPPCLWSYCIW